MNNDKRPFFKVHPVVFPVSASIIALFIFWGIAAPAHMAAQFKSIQNGIAKNFGWFYILSMSGFLIFAFSLAFSRYGNIRLGKDDDTPDFNTLTWFAMLFSAGMGIGLLFWGVAEPVFHYNNPPMPRGSDLGAARDAMAITIFHWGLHPWGLYAIVALALAYFGFRRGLPLSLRSTFYPLIGERIHGRMGDAVDILAVCATLFGVSTSLGLGAMQVNAGLHFLFGVPQSVFVQVMLIACITAIATISVVSGLEAGVRRLSELNMGMALMLLIFVFIAGPTLFLLNAFVENIGAYLQQLPTNSFWTATFEEGNRQEWLSAWTVFYWGWWISWSPFVGMFIARISKGRTIREFIFGVLFAPTIVAIIWLTVFGNAGLHQSLDPVDAETQEKIYEKQTFPVQVLNENGVPLSQKNKPVEKPKTFKGKYKSEEKELVLSEYLAEPVLNEESTKKEDTVSTAMFVMLQQFPWFSITALITTLCIILFFVTSSDSASMVIDIISCGGDPNPPVGTRLFWAILEGVVGAVLLLAGGLVALQTAAITAALPFCFVIILMCFSLMRGLQQEK